MSPECTGRVSRTLATSIPLWPKNSNSPMWPLASSGAAASSIHNSALGPRISRRHRIYYQGYCLLAISLKLVRGGRGPGVGVGDLGNLPKIFAETKGLNGIFGQFAQKSRAVGCVAQALQDPRRKPVATGIGAAVTRRPLPHHWQNGPRTSARTPCANPSRANPYDVGAN